MKMQKLSEITICQNNDKKDTKEDFRSWADIRNQQMANLAKLNLRRTESDPAESLPLTDNARADDQCKAITLFRCHISHFRN
jgi:hypothetical protein